MCNMVLGTIKHAIQRFNFFSFSCDEVTNFNNQSQISIHGYVVENQRRVPLFLNLEKVTKRGGYENLNTVLVNFVHIFGGLFDQGLASKLVCFGANGVTISQGLKIGLIMQFIEKHAPFVTRIHCMAHRCNLIMQTFLSLLLVGKIEAFYNPCMFVFLIFLRSVWSMGSQQKATNKRFENLLQYQYSMDFYAVCVCQMFWMNIKILW